MNFIWYFAHGDDLHTESATGMSTAVQNPAVAWVLVLAAAFALMLGSLWLLKRFSPWQFPARKADK